MPDFDRSQSTGYMTNWAARLFARAIDRQLAPLGVSSGYLPVFFALGGGAELTQSALANVAAIEQPTMANTLGRMERDGLIERRPDPNDRRSALVRLGAEGRRVASRVLSGAQSVNEMALAGLNAQERKTYLTLLARVIDNISAAL